MSRVKGNGNTYGGPNPRTLKKCGDEVWVAEKEKKFQSNLEIAGSLRNKKKKLLGLALMRNSLEVEALVWTRGPHPGLPNSDQTPNANRLRSFRESDCE